MISVAYSHLFYLTLVFSLNSFIFGCDYLKKSETVHQENPLKNFVAPDNYTDLDKKFEDSKFKNKKVIVNFWASWCGPCQEEMPSLLKFVSENKEQVVLISINGDNSEKEMKKLMALFPSFKNENVFTFYDESRKWIQLYTVTGFPETFIYNQKQQFLKHYQGSINFKSSDFKF